MLSTTSRAVGGSSELPVVLLVGQPVQLRELLPVLFVLFQLMRWLGQMSTGRHEALHPGVVVHVIILAVRRNEVEGADFLYRAGVSLIARVAFALLFHLPGQQVSRQTRYEIMRGNSCERSQQQR